MALRRSYPSFLGGGRRSDRERILAQKRVITITEPMSAVYIETPDFALDTLYATDVAQRLFCTDGYYGRTVEFDAAVYTAPQEVGGQAPNESSTWTEIVASHLGPARGHQILWARLPRSEYASAEYIGLWTSVHQDQRYWKGQFSVVHEIWVNARRWAIIQKDEPAQFSPYDTEKFLQKSRRIGDSNG